MYIFLPLDNSEFCWKIWEQECLKAWKSAFQVFGRLKGFLWREVACNLDCGSHLLFSLFLSPHSLRRPGWVSARPCAGWLHDLPEAHLSLWGMKHPLLANTVYHVPLSAAASRSFDRYRLGTCPSSAWHSASMPGWDSSSDPRRPTSRKRL